MDISKMARTAVDFEKTASALYKAAAEKAASPQVKILLEFLIDEESKHAHLLLKCFGPLEVGEIDEMPLIHAAKELTGKMAGQPDPLKAIDLGIELEEKGGKFYRELTENLLMEKKLMEILDNPALDIGRAVSVATELAKQEDKHRKELIKIREMVLTLST